VLGLERYGWRLETVTNGLAGASAAVLLKRRMPQLKVLVVEKTDRFDWKVGESTVEISAYFLTRVLKLYDHLSREQLPKQAFRYWFVNGEVNNLREASEVGPTQLARTPSFQLDRSKLDEHLIHLAGDEGTEVWRPARVLDFELGGRDGNRLTIEREANSVNDNPMIDPEQERVFHTGNFYGAHIARAMDGLKLDMTNLANWMHSLMALIMDERFSAGLPNSLSPHPGLYQGFKGMQLVHTALVTAIRQMSAASLIHTLPTEQFNQDIVSLGSHSALTALDMVRLLRDAMSITLLSLAQAIDLRGGGEMLGVGTRPIYEGIRKISPFLDADRPLEHDIAKVSATLAEHGLPVLQ